MNERLLKSITINALKPNPWNANQLSEDNFKKLKRHIKQTGQYPALIVRRRGGIYEIIDGYHRWLILKELHYKEVICEIWDANDRQVRVLLTTLNRLRGTDDTRKRATLIRTVLAEAPSSIDIRSMLPESDQALDALIKTLQSDAPFDIESERGLIEAQLIQAGVEDEAAHRIANQHKLPGEKATLRFVFFSDDEYNKAAKFFGVRPNTKRLMELVDYASGWKLNEK